MTTLTQWGRFLPIDTAFKFKSNIRIGGASIPSYRRNERSAKAESDAVALLAPKGFPRAAQDPAAQPAVKPDRPVIVRQRPHDEVRESVARQIFARRLEHTSSEAAALALRRQIELEDLAAIAERRHSIPAIPHIADHRIAEST